LFYGVFFIYGQPGFIKGGTMNLAKLSDEHLERFGEKYGEEIMAFVVPLPDQELNAEMVIDFAKSKMTPFKAPSQVKFVDGLPKSLVGKVLKKELRNMI
jgi:acyl-CoA synthetase (AMP-forming)/AMP-acid ligase II